LFPSADVPSILSFVYWQVAALMRFNVGIGFESIGTRYA